MPQPDPSDSSQSTEGTLLPSPEIPGTQHAQTIDRMNSFLSQWRNPAYNANSDSENRIELEVSGKDLLRAAKDPSQDGPCDASMKLPPCGALEGVAHLRTLPATGAAPAGLGATARTRPNPHASPSRTPAPGGDATGARPTPVPGPPAARRR